MAVRAGRTAGDSEDMLARERARGGRASDTRWGKAFHVRKLLDCGFVGSARTDASPAAATNPVDKTVYPPQFSGEGQKCLHDFTILVLVTKKFRRYFSKKATFATQDPR